MLVTWRCVITYCDYRVNNNVELSSGTNYSTISWILLYMVMIDSLLIDRENERESGLARSLEQTMHENMRS
jgi:hypothetical protein